MTYVAAESGWWHDTVGMVEQLLRERLSAGTAIILVTHDAQQAVRMGLRHVRLHEGRLTTTTVESLTQNEEEA